MALPSSLDIRPPMRSFIERLAPKYGFDLEDRYKKPNLEALYQGWKITATDNIKREPDPADDWEDSFIQWDLNVQVFDSAKGDPKTGNPLGIMGAVIQIKAIESGVDIKEHTIYVEWIEGPTETGIQKALTGFRAALEFILRTWKETGQIPLKLPKKIRNKTYLLKLPYPES